MDEMKLMLLGGIDTHGGRLFYETAREKDALPDYYFTNKLHTNFLHPYTPCSRSLIYIPLPTNIEVPNLMVVMGL